LEHRVAVELEPEVDLGIADGLAGEQTGEVDRQHLAQVLVDPGTGLSAALSVLADADPMVFETRKRLLVGLAARADDGDEGVAGAGELAIRLGEGLDQVGPGGDRIEDDPVPVGIQMHEERADLGGDRALARRRYHQYRHGNDRACESGQWPAQMSSHGASRSSDPASRYSHDMMCPPHETCSFLRDPTSVRTIA
jgi:hypothetical protein